MKHYYLVDFENVADTGLEGFFQLTAEDTVYLFYSPKSNRINIDFIQKLLEGKGQANLRFLSVSAGNQALDLQLASFLGSLISQGSEDCVYTIVSRDKGFAVLRSFWSNHAGLSGIQQVSRIADARQLERPLRTEPEKVSAPKSETAEEEPSEPAASAEEQPEPVAAAAESDAGQADESAEPAQNPESARASEVKSESAKEKKPSPPPQNRTSQQNGAAKQALNTSVQQALSKAKYEDKIISPVASLVSRAYGDKKIRQTVYRELIKLFGQKLGLEVYNHVKPLL